MLPQLLLHLVTEADIVNLLFITITALENVSGAVAVSITALECLKLLPQPLTATHTLREL